MQKRSYLAIIGIYILASSTVFALPKGKPFIELNGQIVEVQGEVQTLEEQYLEFKKDVIANFDTLEEKVSGIDTKIEELKDKDIQFALDIAEAISTAATNSESISSLLEDIGFLEEDIASAESEIIALQTADGENQKIIDGIKSDIEENKAKIQLNWDEISANAEGVATLEQLKEDNTDLWIALAQLRADTNNALFLKQNKLRIQCSVDEAISKVYADGGFTCTSTNSINGLKRTTVKGNWVFLSKAEIEKTYVVVPAHCSTPTGGFQQCFDEYTKVIETVKPSTAFATVSCPSGSLKTSQTYDLYGAAQFQLIDSWGSEGAKVTAENKETDDNGYIRAIVVCIGIDQ